MKMKLRPRYYCDHCKKGSGSPSAMKRHEQGCTANPDRFCGLCAKVGSEQQPLDLLVASLGNGDATGLRLLRDITGNCPNCMLAAIRASGLQHPDEWDGETLSGGFHVDFDYRAELKLWWGDFNDTKSFYEEARRDCEGW